MLGRHLGLHPDLVDEDQLARIRQALKALTPHAAALRVGAVALVRHQRQLFAGDVAGYQKTPNQGDLCRDASSAITFLTAFIRRSSEQGPSIRSALCLESADTNNVRTAKEIPKPYDSN